MKRLFVSLLVLPIAATACGSISAKNPDANNGSDSASLTLALPSQSLVQGGMATVDFTVTQTGSGQLTVHVDGLASGVTAADVPVAGSSGTISLAATAAAALGPSSANVQLLDGTQMLDQKPLTVLVSGPPGSLDTTFGTSGRAVLELPDPAVPATMGDGYARAVVVYPATAGADADKILVAVQLETTGSASTMQKLAVVRLNPDGTPDTTFGASNGYALVDGSPANEFVPVGIALDSQQRIVVVANQENVNCDIFVVRLTATGAPDAGFTTFNVNPPGGFCGDPSSVAILPGDKVIINSVWNNPGADDSQRPLLAELNSDGTIDSAAFTSGYVRMPNPDTTKPSMLATTLLVDANGNYIVAGPKCEGGYTDNYSACESVVGRITPAGAWDTTFGTAGTGSLGYSELTFGTTTGNTNLQNFNGIAFDAAGNIVAVGNSEGYTTATIARFAGTNGAVDTSFAASGRATPVLLAGGTIQELDDVAIDAQGRILGIGYVSDGSGLIAVTRYTPAGQLDTAYGTSGVTTEAAGGLGPHGRLQSDGRLIVVGTYPEPGNNSLAVWRFWP